MNPNTLIIHLPDFGAEFHWYNERLVTDLSVDGYSVDLINQAEAQGIWDDIGPGGPIQIRGERGV